MKNKIFPILLSSLFLLGGCSQEKDPNSITEEEYSSFLQLCQENAYTLVNTRKSYYNVNGEREKVFTDDLGTYLIDVARQRYAAIYRDVYSVTFPNPKSQCWEDTWIYAEKHIGTDSWLISTDPVHRATSNPFPEYSELTYDSEKKAYSLTFTEDRYDNKVYQLTDYFYFENGIMTRMKLCLYGGTEFPHIYCDRVVKDIGTTEIEIPEESIIQGFLSTRY